MSNYLENEFDIPLQIKTIQFMVTEFTVKTVNMVKKPWLLRLLLAVDVTKGSLQSMLLQCNSFSKDNEDFSITVLIVTCLHYNRDHGDFSVIEGTET